MNYARKQVQIQIQKKKKYGNGLRMPKDKFRVRICIKILRKKGVKMKYIHYPKRDAIKNYFPVPNEIFCLGLRAGEIALYAYLMKCEDRKTYQCHPSYKTISKALNISKNTVRKYVETLCEKRLIEVEYTDIFTKNGMKMNGNLKYTIRPIQEALNYDLEKQFEKNALEAKKAKAEQIFQKYMQKNTDTAG